MEIESLETNQERETNAPEIWEEEEEDEATKKDDGSTRFLKVFAVIAGWGSTFFGVDTSVIGGAALYVQPDLSISPLQWSWITSVPLLAACFGLGTSIPLCYHIGRKYVVLLAAVLYLAGATMSAAADSMVVLLVGRIILGLGMGLEAMVIPIYLAELVPKQHRGGHLNIFNSLQTFGGFIAAIIDGIFQNVSGGWRYMLGSGVIGPALQLVFALFIPESPRWYIQKGRIADAERSWKRIRKDMPKTRKEFLELKENVENEMKEAKGAMQVVTEILTVPRIRATFVIGALISLAQQWNGATAIAYYLPTLISQMGVSVKNSVYADIPIYFYNSCCTLPSFFLFDRFGRRPVLLATMPILIIGLIISGCSLQASTVASRAGGFFVGLALYYIGYQVGVSPLAWAINGEIYELHVRNWGMSWGAAILLGSAFSVSYTFTRQVRAFTKTGVFGLYAGFTLIFWFILVILMPETNGRTLEDIRNIFDEGLIGLAKYNWSQTKTWVRTKLGKQHVAVDSSKESDELASSLSPTKTQEKASAKEDSALAAIQQSAQE